MAPAIKIKWDFGYQIDAAPRVGLNKPEIEVDVYDVAKVALTAAGGSGPTADLEIQPLPGADKVKFLVVSSDEYADTLTYKVDADTTDYKLNGPLVLIGSGALAFIGTTSPKKLAFTNGHTKAVNLTVVAGRTKS